MSVIDDYRAAMAQIAQAYSPGAIAWAKKADPDLWSAIKDCEARLDGLISGNQSAGHSLSVWTSLWRDLLEQYKSREKQPELGFSSEYDLL